LQNGKRLGIIRALSGCIDLLRKSTEFTMVKFIVAVMAHQAYIGERLIYQS
jgi:hypothetical protein